MTHDEHVSNAGWVAIAVLLGLATGHTPVAAQPTPASCAALAGTTLSGVSITAAVHVPAGDGLPAHCLVNGTENGTEHDIEVRLPDAWQHRYVQRGGGGGDGRIPPIDGASASRLYRRLAVTALNAGAVVAGNNGGHRDRSNTTLIKSPAAIERYAHAAILTSTRFGKAVARTFYGRAPRYSYYEGCSNGGRGAFNAAAKYGDEFDGIIAAAPTFNMVGQVEGWTRPATLPLPSKEALSAIHAAAVAKCDLLDGAADGIISHWSACRFDPATDVPAAAGVTAAEAGAVKTMMTDIRRDDGTIAYSGFGVSDLSRWWPARDDGPGVSTIRNFVDPAWSPTQDAPAGLRSKIMPVLEGRYRWSASPTGLIDFMRAGKKIMVWHGSDDGLVSMADTVRTWQDLVTRAGTPGRENSRLYIPPGVDHCGGGAGADTFDLLTPLMAWVERGTPPATPVARKLGPDGAVLFTRPLCEHPAYPRYRGTGDVNDAGSFACVRP